jgi:hypothetical protein
VHHGATHECGAAQSVATRVRQHRCGSHQYADSNVEPDGDCHADLDAQFNRDADAYAVSHVDVHQYAAADRDADSDAGGHVHRDEYRAADGHADPDTHADSDADGHVHRDEYRAADGHADLDAQFNRDADSDAGGD